MNRALSVSEVRDLPIALDVDVLVLGGGPAGFGAALAAAYTGSSTAVVEAAGYLGGSRTLSAVDTFYGFFTPGDSARRVVGGHSWALVERLLRAGDAFLRENTYGAGMGVTYDVEALKVAMDDAVLASGATPVYHALASEVVLDGNRVSEVVIATKQGRMRARGTACVDCTGDADIAAMAGAPFEMAGRRGPIQSLTTVFFLANVDTERALTVPHGELVAAMVQANRSGRFRLPREDGSVHRTPHQGVVQANMVRVPGVDATSVHAVTAAEIEGRRQAREYAAFLRADIPGYERSSLIATSNHIGVRESRRILGDYVLEAADVIEGNLFDDQVGLCAAPIEDHAASTRTRWVSVGGAGYYGLPYRTILPREVEWLLVAGRCFSATHEAQASARNSAQAMLLGEAAGLAAAAAVRSGVAPRVLDVPTLIGQIEGGGGIVREPVAWSALESVLAGATGGVV